jgi:hypothetical protein
MPSRNPAYADVISGAALSALSVYIVAQALSWPLFGAFGPGPGFFPLVYAAVMLPASLWLFLRGMRGGYVAPVSATNDDDASDAPDASQGGGTQAALATWVALALSVPAMSVAGFVPGIFALTLFVAKIVFRKPWLASLLTAFGISIGLFVLFELLLDIELPHGLLGRELFGRR